MATFWLLALLVGLVEMKTIDLEPEQTVQKRSSVVCYYDLGCFSTDGPFTNSQTPTPKLPKSPDDIKTKFLLYTHEESVTPQILDPRYPSTIPTVWTHFKKRPTKFIIHGFIDDVNISSWMKTMKTELLKHGDYNVVIVDWSHGNLIPYGQAAANTRVVGAQIASIIKVLMKSYDCLAGSFHLIGHSLGAHTAGYAGELVPGLGRISGLDPAGPDFTDTDKVVRLDQSDAVFVDTIHSDAKNLLLLGFGMKQQIGHSDFYPNLGHDQPGCTRDPIVNIIENGLIEGLEEEAACNHLRSIKFFSESINSKCPFMGFPCADEDAFTYNMCHSCTKSGCAPLGFNSDQHIPPNGQSVKYYLSTADKSPFCRYHLDVSVKLANGLGQTEKGTATVIVNGDQGSSGKISLTSSAVNFVPAQTYRFYVLMPKDVGNVQSLTFSWSHSVAIFNPLNWNIFGLRHPKVYVDEIDIYKEESGVDVHLCSGAKSVETDQSLTVSTKC